MYKKDMNESEFAHLAGVQQGTMNRWKNGKSVPDKAADVAEFARLVGRSPLEAFVAAMMVDMDEVERGLSDGERDMLNDVQQMGRRMERNAPRVEARMSEFRESLRLAALNVDKDIDQEAGESEG